MSETRGIANEPGIIGSNQLAVYYALCWYIDQNRRPPTIREIGKLVGKANNSVKGNLARLAANGLVEIEPDSARAYRPLYRVEAV